MGSREDFKLADKVHRYYWDHDINCATTALENISSYAGIEIHPQVIDSAAGLHGAGKYGAQCGLVEGALMYIGISGRRSGMREDDIVRLCFSFAEEFEKKFGDLRCRILRPQGFSGNNPPHLCENLTVNAISFSIEFAEKNGLIPG